MADDPRRRLVGAMLAELERQAAPDPDLLVGLPLGTGNVVVEGWVDLNALAGAVLKEVPKREPRHLAEPAYEYMVQLNAGNGWFTHDREDPWWPLPRVQQYLRSWVGKPEWQHLSYRVAKRVKAGPAELVEVEL